MRYVGLCIDGPRAGQDVECDTPVMQLADPLRRHPFLASRGAAMPSEMQTFSSTAYYHRVLSRENGWGDEGIWSTERKDYADTTDIRKLMDLARRGART